MSIQSDLKKDGIIVINKLDTLVVNSIAKSVAHKIVTAFPEKKLGEKNLFVKLSRLNMYKASMPAGMAEATYFYKNTSIYFNNEINDQDIEEFAIHECIHYLQEVKKKSKLLKMGLCDYTNSHPFGLGLNEAAVQLITSKIIGVKPDHVRYYGIEFKTSSPSYYPVECNILEQLICLYGEDVIFDSTLFSTDLFKNKYINTTSKRNYFAISNAVDDILNSEEKIIKYNNELQNSNINQKRLDELNIKIETLKTHISTTFMRTQNLILSSYFDAEFKKITNLEELDNYRKKLESYRKIAATTEGYFFFDNYYTEKMCALEHKCNMLENGGFETAVIVKNSNKLINLFNTIKNIISKNKKGKIINY